MENSNSIFKVRLNYLLIAIVLFLIEVAIALHVHDDFIRPYVGDVLAVILIYYFVKSFIKAPVWRMAISVLIFSYLIETLQYFQFVKLIGLADNKFANIVIGNYFAWEDIFAYTIGITIVLVIETYFTKPSNYERIL